MILVGGVAELYQGDLDLGRVAVERLAAEDLGPDVICEELHYGAVAVAQRLQDLRPGALVLVGAAERGRPPGTVDRRRVGPLDRSAGEVQRWVADAVTGYVTIDLVVEVGSGLGALPSRTVAVEVEPATTGPSEALSPAGEMALDEALALVRSELRRLPLLEVADRARELSSDGRLEASLALEAVDELLAQLEVLDREGRWAGAFLARDRLRRRIARGETSEGMEHLDWVVWWALIEELDRLERLEAAQGLEGPSSSNPRF